MGCRHNLEFSAMKKLLLASVAALSVLGASAAHADGRNLTMTTLPPPEYDKPYTGELSILRFSTDEEIRRSCKGNGMGIACSSRSPDGSQCSVLIAANNILKARHFNYAVALRHELGHCNGWRHPEGKAGDGRIVPMNDPVKMPVLPASTKEMPVYPPLACVTPDWKPEPCNKRNERPVPEVAVKTSLPWWVR
jgi:hypothetical protein